MYLQLMKHLMLMGLIFNLKVPLTTAPFSNSSPHGVADAILGGSAIGAVGNILGSIFGASSQNDALNAQWKMMQNSMNWQHNERLDTQSYNSVEAEKQRQWQQQMLNQQNAYNSLEQQVQRAQAAGVNPFTAVYGGGSTTAASAPSGSTASSSGWPSVSWAPAYQAQALGARAQMFNSIFGGIKSIASSFKDITEAKKSGVETSYLEQSMDDALKKLREEANGAELANSINRVVLKYKDRLSHSQVDKLREEIDLMQQEGFNKEQEYRESVARVVGILAKSGVDKTTQQMLERDFMYYFDRRKESEIQYNKAKTSEAYSSKGLNDSLKALNDLSYNVRSASTDEEKRMNTQKYINAAEQAGLLTGLMKEQLEQAVRNNDWATVEKIFNLVESGSRSFGNIVGTLMP